MHKQILAYEDSFHFYT